jgi:phosphoribosyl-ATP pyrophosphohydrolase/phosphoribosyl-AMP cyclohydrolase
MENIIDSIKFDEKGLLPVVIQDSETDEVLMEAYMNREALERTMQTGKAHYWSRSRKKLWLKGETSGHFQYVNEARLDCDADTLLLKVTQVEAACHTGNHSCFYRDITGEGFRVNSSESEAAMLNKASAEDKLTPAQGESKVAVGDEKVYNSESILQELYNVIADRAKNPKEGSYTNYLFDKGLDKILKKVGEECAEVIIAAKNDRPEEITYEICDLLYHLLVLMAQQGVSLADVEEELSKRSQKIRNLKTMHNTDKNT